MVKHWEYKTEVLGIKISSEKTTTIKREEGRDHLKEISVEKSVEISPVKTKATRQERLRRKIAKFNRKHDELNRVMRLNQEEFAEWVKLRENSPQGEKEIREFLNWFNKFQKIQGETITVEEARLEVAEKSKVQEEPAPMGCNGKEDF